MIEIISKTIPITSAMKDYVNQQFKFLNHQERGDYILKITLNELNQHTLELILFYQEQNLTISKIETLTDDFYNGVDAITKLLKTQLMKVNNKKRLRSKNEVQKVVHEVTSFEDVLSDLKHQEKQKGKKVKIKDVRIPIFFMTLEEAFEQMNSLSYDKLMYYDSTLDTYCVLIRQENNKIKRLIGILA